MFAANVTAMYPPITNWSHSECSTQMWPQCAQQSKIGHILNVPCYVITFCLYQNMLITFRIYPKCYHNVFGVIIHNGSQMRPIFGVNAGYILNVADFPMFSACVQNVPSPSIWVYWGHMTGYIPNVTSTCPAITLNSHSWVHFECCWFLTTGHIVVASVLNIQNVTDLWLVGTLGLHWQQTFKMCPIFNHWTHCGCMSSEHSKCAQFLIAGYIVIKCCL